MAAGLPAVALEIFVFSLYYVLATGLKSKNLFMAEYLSHTRGFPEEKKKGGKKSKRQFYRYLIGI